jgi:hypothetical protein
MFFADLLGGKLKTQDYNQNAVLKAIRFSSVSLSSQYPT